MLLRLHQPVIDWESEVYHVARCLFPCSPHGGGGVSHSVYVFNSLSLSDPIRLLGMDIQVRGLPRTSHSLGTALPMPSSYTSRWSR